jgi:hypothetical protein
MSTLPDSLNTGHPPTVGSLVAVKSQGPDPSELLRALEEAKTITRQVFSRSFECVEQEDAEIVGDRHFEFRVLDDGDLADILSRDDEWHRRIAMLPVSLVGLFRLAIDVQD